MPNCRKFKALTYKTRASAQRVSSFAEDSSVDADDVADDLRRAAAEVIWLLGDIPDVPSDAEGRVALGVHSASLVSANSKTTDAF